MGKGDRKTTKGKRFMSSYGKTRPRNTNQSEFVPQQVKPSTAKVALEDTKAKAPKAEKKATKTTTKKAAEKKPAATKKPAAKKSTKKDEDSSEKE